MFSSLKKSSLVAKVFIIASISLSSLASASISVPVLDNKSCEMPKYPKASLMNEEAGTVIMNFLINTDGKVVDSKIEKSSGFKNLDKAAITSFSSCKFKPGIKDGKVDQLWVPMSFVWKLD